MWRSEAALARRRAALCGWGCATGYAILHKRTRRLRRCSPSLESDGEVAQGRNRGGPAAELDAAVAGGASRSGQSRTSPGSWASRVDVRCPYEAKSGVSWGRSASAARNHGGGAISPPGGAKQGYERRALALDAQVEGEWGAGRLTGPIKEGGREPRHGTMAGAPVISVGLRCRFADRADHATARRDPDLGRLLEAEGAVVLGAAWWVYRARVGHGLVHGVGTCERG